MKSDEQKVALGLATNGEQDEKEGKEDPAPHDKRESPPTTATTISSPIDATSLPLEESENKDSIAQNLVQQILQHPYALQFGLPVGLPLLCIFLAHPWMLFRWFITVIAWALGIALGLGWSMHVYEQLDTMTNRQREQDNEPYGGTPKVPPTASPRPVRAISSGQHSIGNIAPALATTTTTTTTTNPMTSTMNDPLEDEQNYTSLMQAAGYPVKVLRGQVFKTGDPFWQENYPFERGARATQAMQDLFPSLPESVRMELAKFIEHVMRDYVSSWYSMIDATVSYQEEREKRKQQAEAKVAAAAASATLASTQSPSIPRPRRMIYKMAPYRKAPFIEKLYETLTVVFGNLATRVEHVNVFELALLKWTKVLAHTFKTYRHLRRIRVSKHPSVTEMDVTKEFLFAGKLHKAVTFGLDVPALLFADATGKECLVGKPDKDNNKADNGDEVFADENAVLEARLFGSGILTECELDYNRVVAHRMIRALLPRADFGSPLVSSLVTEIMAGCVLTPLMSCFCPSYLNSWIISGLESTGDQLNTPGDEGDVPSEQGIEVQVADSAHLIGEESPFDISENSDSGLRDFPLEKSEPDKSMNVIPEGRVSNIPRPHPHLQDAHAGGMGNARDLPAQLAQVLIDLQDYMDLPEMRQAKMEGRPGPSVDWDDAGCRAVILQLVLVLEAALMDGRCTYRVRNESRGLDDDEEDLDDSDRPVEVTLTQYESITLSQLLMELTSDIEAFEERVANENTVKMETDRNGRDTENPHTNNFEVYKPTAIEQSTLRTLIVAWLHTGQVHRTLAVLSQAYATVLLPYYHERAFLRSRQKADDLLKVLQSLDGVDLMIDTTSLLNSPRLDDNVADNRDDDLLGSFRPLPLPSHHRTHSEQSIDSFPVGNALSLGMMSNNATPRYVDFHRNEAFAASLRSERDRRTQSWNSLFEGSADEGVPIICHTRGSTEEDMALYRELHHLAKIFYSGTNLVSVRDAARRISTIDDRTPASPNSSIESSSSPVSLLTVEMASPRRRIEVPDDDSSFLLRAQPRPLNAVGVHRDQRNHDQSFKCFAGTYEEPALSTDHFAGGRYIRYCLIRYYPIDRTASIALHADVRRVDQRRTKSAVPDTITLGSGMSRQTPFLSGDFLRERHLCQRWVPRGTTRTQSILASSVMEPTDFTSQPRTGKAMDFVYRMTFFEKPMIELGGKIFTVHDSTSLGTHRADASGLEMSDAALSAILLSIGEGTSENRHIEMGEDGYPIIWMKFSRKQDDGHIEVRPYRVSFVRAALLVTAARQEAQLQSLVACVKAGSAKKATKAQTDAKLKPTLRLLEYAGTRSREKQSLLLRDMKLGVNHIDRGQLRRNGLLSPRYPTSIQELFVTVEDCFSAEDVRDADLFGCSGIVYRIRVAAIVILVADEGELEGLIGYRTENGAIASAFREEWIVYRNFKEFQTLHKHLKSQVSTSESSGTAVSRLSASLNSNNTAGRRHRSALIPSLSQASKIGALGLTKKSLQKRREYLDGYLAYLFAPDHLLNRCPELLLFVGAFYPLPQEVRAGHGAVSRVPDPLGRTKMSRTVVRQKEPDKNPSTAAALPASPSRLTDGTPQASVNPTESDLDAADEGDSPRKLKKQPTMIPGIRNKIDKIPLSQVRNRLFELLRYQFGFENASFVRNRMLAALKTASFAITSASEFRRTLYNLHKEHLSALAVSGWIKFGLDMLWPDGVFFESSPPLTAEELQNQVRKSRAVLHKSFPDALRAVLGQELTKDGLDVLHEMLQNRIVVKSLFYKLFDLLWLEVFPEIADVLQGGAALDLDI